MKKNKNFLGIIYNYLLYLAIYPSGYILGAKMDFITNFFGAIDFNVIFQLTFVALIMIAGPVVIFLLALRGGDL